MKKLLFLLLFGAVAYPLQAQPPIVTATTLQPGLYRSFDEFINNAPSVQSPYEPVIEPMFKISKPLIGKIKTDPNPDTTRFRHLVCKFPVSTRQAQKVSKDVGKVYGYCDGQHIFLHTDTFWYNNKTAFSLASLVADEYVFFLYSVKEYAGNTMHTRDGPVEYQEMVYYFNLVNLRTRESISLRNPFTAHSKSEIKKIEKYEGSVPKKSPALQWFLNRSDNDLTTDTDLTTDLVHLAIKESPKGRDNRKIFYIRELLYEDQALYQEYAAGEKESTNLLSYNRDYIRRFLERKAARL